MIKYNIALTHQDLLSIIFCSHPSVPNRDCSEVPIESGNGIYNIIPFNNVEKEIDVYCDLETNTGGWTVNMTLIMNKTP